MSKDEQIIVSPTLAERRPDLADEADGFASASLSDATKRAIKFDWQVFADWCAAHGFQAMPASIDTAAGFVVDQARSKKLATLLRYRATIGKLHKLKGFPSPFADARVKAVIEGIRRKKGVTQNGKQPMTIIVASELDNVRDRAIVLFGLATSFRGKELCSLDIEDLKWVDAGVIVTLRRSKTDQQGRGRPIGVPRVGGASCPVAALEAWLAMSGETAGPVFRGFLSNGKVGKRRLTAVTINLTVKSVAAAAGFDPDSFGAHSLRAGYVTEARKAGLTWEAIMEQTGHKRIETVNRYDRGTIDPFKASRVAEVFSTKKRKR